MQQIGSNRLFHKYSRTARMVLSLVNLKVISILKIGLIENWIVFVIGIETSTLVCAMRSVPIAHKLFENYL